MGALVRAKRKFQPDAWGEDMGYPKLGDLSVRVTAVGHASSRWRSAQTREDADRNNQLLSERRANNVRNFVETILKRELPDDIHVGVSPQGVGNKKPLMPERPVDDFAINRSVVVTIDITTIHQALNLIPGKKRINARTKHWSLRVLGFARMGFGLNVGVVTIALKNQVTGKEMEGKAEIMGGGTPAMSKKRPDLSKLLKPIGKEVYFTSREAMGFDDFHRTALNTGKLKVKIVYGNEMTYIKFPFLHHDPDLLVFDYDQGWGWSADAFDMSGQLFLYGTNPGDYYEVDTIDDVIQIPRNQSVDDGLMISFATGMADMHSLTSGDRRRLEDFARTKARTIAALAESFAFSAVHP